MKVAHLAGEVATREHLGQRADGFTDAVETTRIALVHLHLPKLAELEIIDYRDGGEWVELTTRSNRFEGYL